MYVTFCGHGDILCANELRQWLRQVLQQLIAEDTCIFYLGGYGDFDRLAAEIVKEQKQAHPEIQMILVLPYINAKINCTEYDSTLYPPLKYVPPRFAILRRNQWMVEAADVVIAYVIHSWGGAAKTLGHAKRKKKRIVQYVI